MDQRELTHYGVRGMKWGVRRAIGKNSREAARVGRFEKGTSKLLAKNERKLELAKKYSLDTATLQKRVNTGRALVDGYKKRRMQLTKGMSTKDIASGKKGVLGREIAVGLLTGPIGAVLFSSVTMAKANLNT